jgi:hypothetical protein
VLSWPLEEDLEDALEVTLLPLGHRDGSV